MMHTKQYALLTDAICAGQTSFMIFENISCSFILVIHKNKYYFSNVRQNTLDGLIIYLYIISIF